MGLPRGDHNGHSRGKIHHPLANLTNAGAAPFDSSVFFGAGNAIDAAEQQAISAAEKNGSADGSGKNLDAARKKAESKSNSQKLWLGAAVVVVLFLLSQ